MKKILLFLLIASIIILMIFAFIRLKDTVIEFSQINLKENTSSSGIIDKKSEEADQIEIVEDNKGYTLESFYSIKINNNSNQEYDYTYVIENNENKGMLKIGENQIKFDFPKEEKYNILLTIEKNGEPILTWTKEISYIKPYEKQFLDELEDNSTILHVTSEDFNTGLPKSIELLKSIGMSKVRVNVMWSWVGQSDNISFAVYNSKLNMLNDNGIDILAIINTNDSPYNGDDKMVADDEEVVAYVSFVDQLSNKFPFIKEYEISNEVNTKYTGEKGRKAYARLTTEAYNILKYKDKQNKIITGATVQVNSEDFIREISKYGAYENSDAYSYHIYKWRASNGDTNEDYKNYIYQHKDLINSLGGFKPIYITETGVSNATTENTSEERQAEVLVQQSIIRDKQSVDEGMIYNFRNTGDNPDSKEASFGIIEYNYRPKLTYYSLKNYYENTNGAEYIGTINLEDGIEAHVYDKDGKTKIITWATDTNYSKSIEYEGFIASDMYGNEIENTDGTLTITSSPVYLDNISTKYFYEAISNTALEKYAEFEEKFSSEIGKVDGLQEQINKLKDYMTSIKDNESETQEKAVEMMHEHFYLGTMVLDAFSKEKLNVEYVKVSSMLDILNDIGDSYEDLLTVSATSREAYYTATEELINKAETTINNNSDLNILYPSKILDFAKELHEKSEYIIGLEDENDIKTGLIVSNSLHAYYLADWANDFANIYVNKYIKQNPITVSYSNTDEYTNQDVTVTLNIGSDSKVTNNEGNNIYTFTHNGTFTFEYERRGQAFEEKVTVTSIDKEAPTISGVVNGKIYTDSAKPVIKDDNLEKIEVLFNGTNIQFNSGNTLKDEGIYNITATDKAGNVTSVEIYIVEKGEEGYIIENGYILNVKQKTTINNFATKFNLSSGYTIKRNDKAITNKDIIATGDILQLKNGAEYTIVVAGDINKDGKVTTYDLSTFRRYILGLREFDELESLAADINVDKQALGVKDYTRMRIEILGEY